MPGDLDSIISCPKIEFDEKDLKVLERKLYNFSVRELLHIVMKLSKPEVKKDKYDIADYNTKLLKDVETFNRSLNQIDFS
jgi:hypothetical protein